MRGGVLANIDAVLGFTVFTHIPDYSWCYLAASRIEGLLLETVPFQSEKLPMNFIPSPV